MVYTTGEVTPQQSHSLTDAGRTIGPGGYSQFSLTIDPNNEGVILTRRVAPSRGEGEVRVLIDDVEAATWPSPPISPGWTEQSVRLPPSCTAGKSVITVRNCVTPSSAEFTEFTYWARPIVWGVPKAEDAISIGLDSEQSERAHDYEVVNPTWSGVSTYDVTNVSGGWFVGALRVQVRQNFSWLDVGDLNITPSYSFDETVPSHTPYTLTFAPTWGDGIRLIGTPGGTGHFTSISELEVYYDGSD